MKNFTVDKWQKVYIQMFEALDYFEYLLSLVKQGDIRRNSLKDEMTNYGYALQRYGKAIVKAGELLAKERFAMEYVPNENLKFSPELVSALQTLEPFIKESNHQYYIELKNRDKEQAKKRRFSFNPLYKLANTIKPSNTTPAQNSDLPVTNY